MQYNERNVCVKRDSDTCWRAWLSHPNRKKKKIPDKEAVITLKPETILKRKKAAVSEKERRRLDLIQREHDAALGRRLYLQCGYGHGEVKVFTAEEIEKFIPQ
jgi:hypothetical protein